MKKTLLFALLALLPLMANAYDAQIDGIYYNFSGENAMVTHNGSNSYSGDIVIPEYVIYNGGVYHVTSIGQYAFNGCSTLKSVKIPEGVTTIGRYAFDYCTKLTSIIIPNTIRDIEEAGFAHCDNLSYLTISNGVINIGNYAFSGCYSLVSVNIPETVTRIGDYAFWWCSGLTSVTISESVTNIGNHAFENCSHLKEVFCMSLHGPNTQSATFNNSNINSATLYVPESAINDYTNTAPWSNFGTISSLPYIFVSDGIYYKINSDGISVSVTCPILNNNTYFGTLEIPTSVKYKDKIYSVTGISPCAFYSCDKLTYVSIPNSVTDIGNCAFYNCSGLTSISIPNSVTSIGYRTFAKCTGLTFISIPNSVTTIGNSAFWECINMISITIPNSVTVISHSAFETYSNLREVYCLSDQLPNTDSEAFLNTNIESATLYVPETSVNVYQSATPWKNFGNIVSLSSYDFVDDDIYYKINADETSVSVSSRDGNYNSYAGSVVIPSTVIYNDKQYSVTRIGSYAFSGCNDLTSVTIPNSVISIGERAIPSTVKIYVDKGVFALMAVWNYGFNPYDLSTNALLTIPTISRRNNSASSLSLFANNSTKELKFINELFTVNGVTKAGHAVNFTGLNPNCAYDVLYSVTVKYGGESSTYTIQDNLSTSSLSLTLSQPKVISLGNVIVAATSNLDDEEENVGFEWRRMDWPDEISSNSGIAYLYEGTMEGYIRSLNTNYYWKVRPYYKTNDETYYYGEWGGFDPTNTSYFEPTVHTYAKINVTGNKAQVSGYVQRASDAVIRQGFKYWIQEDNEREAEDNARGAGISIPSSAKTIEAEGRVMEAEFTNLQYNTTYTYVAFVTTTEGETFYGKQLTFTTGEDPDATLLGDANGNGVVEIGDVTSVLTLMATPEATGYDNKAADANGNGEIEIGDVTTILTIMAEGE